MVAATLLAFVLAACAGSGGGSVDQQQTESTPMATGSLPGETSIVAAQTQPTTSLAIDEPQSTADRSNGADDPGQSSGSSPSSDPIVTPGAASFPGQDFPEFFGARVGLIASRASVIGERSVIDVLAESDEIDLVTVFAAEHGIRADAGAGEELPDGIDPVTGLPVISLYGATRKPTPQSLADLDVLVFDLQDVGARFYTYTATMGLAMQAAAEAGIPFVVLDRPNPLGGFGFAGPLRADDKVSFVSQYPVPSTHGMTAGELALAIVGEGWLDGLTSLDLRVAELSGWNRDQTWIETGLPWVPPSPGLPTVEAATVYPATVLFEATTLSYGRGTDHPFSQVGAPWLDGPTLVEQLELAGLPGVTFVAVEFTPVTDPANGPPVADPQWEGVAVSGVRLEVADAAVIEPVSIGIHLLAAVLAQAAELRAGSGGDVVVIDRPDFFDLLAGTTETRRSLQRGDDPADIVAAWSDQLAAFERVRSRYLLY